MKNKLLAFKASGERTVKRYNERATNVLVLNDWLLTYQVENFVRCLGVSRLDKTSFDGGAFLYNYPLITEVFGPPVKRHTSIFPLRGFTIVFALNDCHVDPFFVAN